MNKEALESRKIDLEKKERESEEETRRRNRNIWERETG